MELAVKAWVFNPELRGHMVLVSGRDEEGDKIHEVGTVAQVIGDQIEVIVVQGDEVKLHKYKLHEFSGEERLALEVYDQPPTKLTLPDL
ncbi:hypothetical protein [Paenibacillus polymyxa]|uniref:hypothetical protein n=1 Tax=Paenibacillus polymyxa TaxID=1406 RepID=UPI001117CE77|nr:hypothetical protein [Paenibacillus polymyxa]QDA30235.1 hypothetical protein FGY93_25285 [Paenibacillus polymyxa]